MSPCCLGGRGQLAKNEVGVKWSLWPQPAPTLPGGVTQRGVRPKGGSSVSLPTAGRGAGGGVCEHTHVLGVHVCKGVCIPCVSSHVPAPRPPRALPRNVHTLTHVCAHPSPALPCPWQGQRCHKHTRVCRPQQCHLCPVSLPVPLPCPACPPPPSPQPQHRGPLGLAGCPAPQRLRPPAPFWEAAGARDRIRARPRAPRQPPGRRASTRAPPPGETEAGHPTGTLGVPRAPPPVGLPRCHW